MFQIYKRSGIISMFDDHFDWWTYEVLEENKTVCLFTAAGVMPGMPPAQR